MESKHEISLEQAIEMTKRYRQERETILSKEYAGKDLLPFSETFSRDAFDSLLQQEGCASIRLYLGMDTDLRVHAIFVGVNERDEDILPAIQQSVGAMVAMAETQGKVIEQGIICPPTCPTTTSPLSTT